MAFPKTLKYSLQAVASLAAGKLTPASPHSLEPAPFILLPGGPWTVEQLLKSDRDP